MTRDLSALKAALAAAQEAALDYIAHAFNRHDRTRPRHTIPRRDDDHDAVLMGFLRAAPELIAEVERLRAAVEAADALAEAVATDPNYDCQPGDPVPGLVDRYRAARGAK